MSDVHHDQARIVIIGGGAVGTGVALQLAEAGFTDILLLEREASLCAVTSPQAAGLVGQVRSSLERTKLAMWSVATFARLEREGEVKPSWRQTGSLRLAQTQERVAEFRRMMAVAEEAGLEVELLDAPAAARMWPHLDFEAAKAILWCPSDGYLQPADLVAAYQHEARKRGVRFRTSSGVAAIRLKDGRVAGVTTRDGMEIACEMVINAAGAHGYHVGRLVGLDLPVIPVRHHYVITTPTDWIRPDMPVLRMPDGTLYARADVNALLIGGWEPEAMSLDPRSYTLNDRLPPIAEDWPVLANFMEEFRPFGGPLCDQPVRHVFTGWPTFTPDGRFIIGESSQVPGFVCAAGCNAHGVSGSAGIGRHVVEALTEANPSPYVKSLSPDRFTQAPWDFDEARRRAQHVLETYYHIGH
ncbi:FAD-dependent oxidoreductase [Bosea sp. 117]|uniref:NAD(P)/FAD-dependent oxidoreductase n=1 Tax=Bosea sp. 117 TaxID=1125973 RepID=UPI000494D963|nr:FAD-dependent oxidoreductase [Bosea sp. 117]